MVEWKKLGEIGKCMAGATPSTKESSYWDNGTIPWMSSGEVHQGVVKSTSALITQKGYDNSSTKMLPSGTVVIALAGQGKTRGTVAITAIELCTNQSLCGVVIDNDSIINKYVYFYLKTRYDDLRRISSGEGTRGGLNLKMIGSYLIPVPSLSEQKRIVGILDTFTSSIENLKEQIALRRKQYEYYRDQLLDLEGKDGTEMKIADFCLLKAGKSISSEDITENESDNSYPCIGGNGKRGYVSYFSHEGAYPIIGRQGALCGCVNWITGKFYATEHAVVAKGSAFMDQRFLFYLFENANLNQYKTQGAQPGLSVAKLNEVRFIIPPLAEQQRIVGILDVFEESIQNLEAQLAGREKQYEYYRNKLLTFK